MEFSPITHLLVTKNIHYKLESKWNKFTLLIPSLNIYIDKYILGNYYYVYIKDKFIKKIKAIDLLTI